MFSVLTKSSSVKAPSHHKERQEEKYQVVIRGTQISKFIRIRGELQTKKVPNYQKEKKGSKKSIRVLNGH